MHAEIYEKLQSLPKADLHVHFEGTVGASTLCELAARNGMNLRETTKIPGYPEIAAPRKELLEAPFQGTFFDFIQYYVKTTSVIRTEEDFALIAERYGIAARSENICAVEMYFTPTTFLAFGHTEASITEGLKRVTEILKDTHGISIQWIFDIVRNAAGTGRETLEIATRARDSGVPIVALGLAGLEAGYPPSPFAPVLLEGRDKGFRIYVHAGETAGAESVRETLSTIRPDRIGHGVRAIEDQNLLQELKAQRIPLEVCPWSNVALHVYPEDGHPVKALFEAGLDLVLASDDPGIFAKNLTDNYLFAYEHGISLAELSRMAERSIQLSGLA